MTIEQSALENVKAAMKVARDAGVHVTRVVSAMNEVYDGIGRVAISLRGDVLATPSHKRKWDEEDKNTTTSRDSPYWSDGEVFPSQISGGQRSQKRRRLQQWFGDALMTPVKTGAPQGGNDQVEAAEPSPQVALSTPKQRVGQEEEDMIQFTP